MNKRRIKAYIRKPRDFTGVYIVIIGLAILIFGIYFIKLIGA